LASDPSALRAPHTVSLAYERSVGGATEAFLRGLARAEIVGSRMADGRLVVPPVDHDAATGAAPVGLERVADTGVVRSWTAVAGGAVYALVRLDGADTSLLHVLDVEDADRLSTGLRVRADWRDARVGSIHDVRAFVPEAEPRSPSAPVDDPVEVTVTANTPLEYTFEPGLTLSGFYRALGEGRIEGGRCPRCEKVYVPPRPQCPVCGTAPMHGTRVDDVGTIVSRALVHLPVPGMEVDLPFAWAWIRLDGTDVPFAHLIGEVDPGTVRAGRRVAAVWVEADKRPASWEAIRWFRPIDARR
jgi:uncharacterized OB-fold protein